MKIIIPILFVFCQVTTYSQANNVDSLITVIYSRLDAIESYEADATISVDVDFIQMPDKTGHVAYQAPDSFRVDTDGFLMIPKIGMKPLTRQLDLTLYQAVDMGTESFRNTDHAVVNLIPLKRGGRVVLATAWIDIASSRVSRIETFTKKNGSYTVDLFYTDEILPSSLDISFEIEGMNIPMKYFGPDVSVDKQEMKMQEVSTGTVHVELKNYRITSRSSADR